MKQSYPNNPALSPHRFEQLHGSAQRDKLEATPLTILHLDASARFERSISRGLSRAFLNAWLELRRDDRVLRRDLSLNPPPFVTEEWIAAAFTAEADRSNAMRAALSYSDAAIDELTAADLIVLGTPMYNYGVPGVLKAWIDQVIRIGRTFSFDLARGDWPIEPLQSNKRLVVLSARGEFGFQRGEVRAGWNHLDPYLATCAGLLGVAPHATHLISVEYQEFKDDRFARSLEHAQDQVRALVRQLVVADSSSSTHELREVSA